MTTAAGRIGTADRRAFVAPYRNAWNDHDVERILSFLADDVVWAHPVLPEPLHGKAAVRKDLEDLFRAFPDIHFLAEDKEILTSRDTSQVMATWVFHATMKGVLNPGFAPTGRTVRIRGASLYRLRDGLIREHTIIFDGLDYLQQLGLLPRERALSFRLRRGAHNISARIRERLHR